MDVVTKDYKTTKLVDGMIKKGFSNDSLVRKYSNKFGYYLHLHGSPLFYSKENHYKKHPRNWLAEGKNIPSNHIVLTHFSKKTSVIAASEILSTYWDLLSFAINESSEIILFGYSGLDKHLNQLLKFNAESKPIRVVEWSEADKEENRKKIWRNELGRDVCLIRLNNILEFKNWE